MAENAQAGKILLISDAKGKNPALNMAVDETLSKSSKEARELFASAFMRFYSWEYPCVSFGYAQSYQQVISDNPGLPLVRRPTGGGVVLHGKDITYSVVFFPKSLLFNTSRNDLYIIFHTALKNAFLKFDVICEIRNQKTINNGYYRCFEKPVAGDLLLADGRKIAGAAQKHSKDVILIQGSVSIDLVDLNKNAFIHIFVDEITKLTGLCFEKFALNDSLKKSAADLAQKKYMTDKWNMERRV